MQGTSGRSYSELCFALNNAADGSLRLARGVKSDEIKRSSSFLSTCLNGILFYFYYLLNL